MHVDNESFRVKVLRAISDDYEDIETICRDIGISDETIVVAILLELISAGLACPFLYSHSQQIFSPVNITDKKVSSYWFRATKAGKAMIAEQNSRPAPG